MKMVTVYNMKTLLLLLFILVNIPSLAQVKRVAIGDDSIVYVFDKRKISTHSCKYGTDTCYYEPVDVRWIEHPFFSGINYPPYRDGIIFAPKTEGEFIDTIRVEYHWVFKAIPICPNTTCTNYPEPFYDTIIVRGFGYYDNSVKLKVKSDFSLNSVYFSLDSTGEKYDTTPEYLFMTIYNNHNEDIECSDWMLDVDPTTQIKMEVDTFTSNVVNLLQVPKKSFKSARLNFTTTSLPKSEANQYIGHLNIPFQAIDSDSSLSSPIIFNFPKKIVLNDVKGDDRKKYQIYIYPNPAASATISCYIPGSTNQPVQLSIFDVLANKRLSFLDGMVHSGDYNFNVDLPIGAYFVRFVTPEGVQMLNLISTQ